MPEMENWEKYRFPNPEFSTAYLPMAGLGKALNERLGLTDISDFVIPDFFSRIEIVTWSTLSRFDGRLRQAAGNWFVNPDKIEAGVPWQDYFWTWPELLLAGADGVEADIIDTVYPKYPRFAPAFPVKWAMQRYHMINLLRYVPTVREDYPDFEYEDKYSTFNFKA